MKSKLTVDIGPELDLPLLKQQTTYPFIFHEVVRANLLHSIAPHLAHIGSFAVHKHGGSIHHWVVSNIETGMNINGAGVFQTRDDAAHAAWYFLAEVSEEKLSKAINACPVVTGF